MICIYIYIYTYCVYIYIVHRHFLFGSLKQIQGNDNVDDGIHTGSF